MYYEVMNIICYIVESKSDIILEFDNGDIFVDILQNHNHESDIPRSVLIDALQMGVVMLENM